MSRPVYLDTILCGTKGLAPGPKIVTRSKRSETIRGVEWFYFFIPKENVMGLSEVIPGYEQMFLVCGHFPNGGKKPLKMFAAFESYLTFLNYIRDVPRENWNFFEVILGNRRQKFYVDLDIEEGFVPLGRTLNEFAQEILDFLIDRLIELFEDLGFPFNIAKHLLIFSSHGPQKRSYHLVIDKYCVMDNNENADLMREILKSAPPEFVEVQEGPDKSRKIIDIGMYSRKQQFRLYGSQKTGSGRPKIFQTNFLYRGQTIEHDYSDIPPMDKVSRQLFEFTYIFQKSCVTFVENCLLITVNESLDDGIDLPPSRGKLWSEKGAFDTEKQVSPEMIAEALEIIRTRINPEVWAVGDVGMGMVNLRRKRPANCEVCSRAHDNENAFVSINPRWGDLTLHCWRDIEAGSGGKNGVNIGKVKADYLEQISKNHLDSALEKWKLQKMVKPKTPEKIPKIIKTPEPVDIKLPFTGSVTNFVKRMTEGREPSYF